MAIELPKIEEISGGGKNRGNKGVGSTIRRKRANKGSVQSAWGKWGLGKANSHFDPTQMGLGTAPQR